MTKQTINASLLNEAADVMKQVCVALQDKACEYIIDNPLAYYRWQQALENGRMFRAQIQLLAEDLQEQEQASAGEPVTTSGYIQVIPPQFAVGDTVRFFEKDSTIRTWFAPNELVMVTSEQFTSSEGIICVNCENNYGTEQIVAIANLTLIAKGQA